MYSDTSAAAIRVRIEHGADVAHVELLQNDAKKEPGSFCEDDPGSTLFCRRSGGCLRVRYFTRTAGRDEGFSRLTAGCVAGALPAG